ncbi:BRCA1-associated protein [Trichonephila clavipes]|nr:BRCA1-associated protein [Trichonephila clavipes]
MEELRIELNRRDQEIMAMNAKMKTLEEQHHDYQRHIAVLKESLCAKEEHYNMLQADNYHTHLEEEYANYNKPPDGADCTSQKREFTAKRNRRSTASGLSRQLSSATGTTVSRQTVYRRLGHIGLYARRPVRCVPLIATHCRLRLTWNREHALWTPQQWFCVMFSDESRFSLQSDSRRTLIWRAPGTHYHQEETIE